MRLSFFAVVALLFVFQFCSQAFAQGLVPQEWGVVNAKKMVKTATSKLTKEQCKNNQMWQFVSYDPYARIVKYKIKPGSRYTLYVYYYTGPPLKNADTAPSANIYCSFFNPLSSIKPKESGSFVAYGQTPYKREGNWTGRRLNFTVDSKSTSDTLYLVIVSSKPGWPMGALLKFPADPDSDLKTSTYNTISKVRGFTWGTIYKNPFFCERLKGDPVEKGPAQGASTSPATTQPPVVPSPPPKMRKVRQADIGQSLPHAGYVDYNTSVAAIMEPQDYDMFRIDFAGGQFLCYSEGDLDLVADIVDSSGKKIARDLDSGSGGNFRFNRYLKPGTYGIQVRVMRHSGSGSYRIVFGNGSYKTEERYLETRPLEKISKAYLGLAVKAVSVSQKASLGLPSGSSAVVVTQVSSNGPAFKAGLKQGDVILKLGGRIVKSANDVKEIVSSRKPGDNLNAVVVSPVNIKLGKDDF